MTSLDPPPGSAPDPIDELASAIVDGEVAPSGHDVDPSSPEVAARVAAFRRVAEAVAATDAAEVDPDRRDAAITAALAAWPGPADELAARRAARARWVRPLGVAAAVLAAVAIGGVALRAGDDGDRDQQTTALAAEADDSAGAAADASLADGAGAAPLAETEIAADRAAAAGVTDFGAAATVEELTDRVGAMATAADGVPPGVDDNHEGDGAPPTTVLVPGGAASAGAVLPCPPPALPSVTGTALVDGRVVDVYVLDDGAGSRRVLVYDEDGCAVLADRPLAP